MEIPSNVGAGLLPETAVPPPRLETAVPKPRTVMRIRPSPRWRPIDFQELWHYRELLYFLTWRDFKIRYKQTALGAAWAVIQPLFSMLVFTLLFGKLGGFDKRTGDSNLPYEVFSLAALVPWTYFANAITMSSQSLIGTSAHLITKVYFPRLLVPMSAVLAGLVDYLVALVMLALVMAWYQIVPTAAALVMIPLLTLLLSSLALGVGLWLSAMSVHYRDIRYVVPFLLQLWMFGSPIIYSLSSFPEKYVAWVPWIKLNPLAGILENFRAALLGQPLDLASLSISVALSLAILISGCFYFRSMERTFADLI